MLLAAKISPIICIGEKERHHDGSHWQVISHELHNTLSSIPRSLAKNCIIAYEPIWAIGKNAKRAMNTEEISESAIFIKKILAEMFGVNISKSIRVIYGGSVDAKNASAIAHASGISGFLVGRDSLIPSHFAKIIDAIK
jgi:triosephosphate isomerase